MTLPTGPMTLYQRYGSLNLQSASHPLECTCVTEIVSIVDTPWSLPFAPVILAVGQRGAPQVCQHPRPMKLSTVPVVATCCPSHVPVSVC